MSDELAACRRELAAAKAELQTAVESYKAFAYSISHDLRAPLRAMAGFASMLEDSLGDEPADDRRHMLDVIRENAHLMSAQIDALLALSRLEHRELRSAPVDMTELARRAVDRVRALHPTREVLIAIGPLAAASGDADLLQIAFDELVRNAWKFTRNAVAPRVEIASETTDGETIYRVRDNGVGFSSASAERLFVIFRRLHSPKEYEGLGTGLATVKAIVHRHGGRVWAESAPGATTFSFSLPTS